MEEEIKLEAVLKFLRTNNFSKTESALREEIDFVRNQTYSTDDDEADLPKLPPVRLQASDGHSENDIDGNSIANSIESARFLSIANTPEGFFDLDVDSFPYCASGDTYLCGKPWPLRPVSRGRSEDLSDRLSGFLTAGEGDCLSLSDSGNENPCHNSDSSTQEDNNDLGFRRQLVEDRPRFLAKEISGVEIDEQVKFENICDVNEDSKGSHAQKQAVSDEETWELSSVVYVNNLETRSTFCKVITCGTEDYEAKRICYESPCKLKSQKSCYTSNDQMHSRAADEQVESSEDDDVHGTSQNCLAVSSTLYAGSEPGSKSCEVDHKDECDSRVQVHNSFKEDLSYQLSAAGFQTLTSNAPHSTERNNNGSSSTASSVKDKEILSMGPFERLDLASQTSNDCLYAKEASEDVLKENPNERCEIEDSANEPLEDMEDPEFLFQQQDNGGEEEHEEFTLKIIHRRNRTGFEEEKDFTVHVGSVIAGRYHVTEYLGSAAFSKAIQAHDLHTGIDVCMKIIKNNKDFFDQSLDEIKLLKYVNRHDPADKHHILRLYDYFYYREHLFIVCELLRANLYEFQMFNKDSGEEYYFNMPHLQSIARQVLESLDFLHGIGLIHCDLKPENILMKSYSRCEVKIIDLGSSCFQTDNLCSYVQSRSYRAPEVILGLPYDEKIDIWSVGCILGELCSGSVLFDNDSVATLLARIIGMLGPIGPEMLARGCETHKYFTNSHLLYERDEETDKLEYIIPKETSLAQHLPTTDAGFLEFVTYLLQINPMHRPNAKQALDHPWLSMEYEEI